MSGVEEFVRVLGQPASALSYSVSKELAARYPERYVLETGTSDFDLEEFAASGHCVSRIMHGVHCQIETAWHGAQHPLAYEPKQAWHEVAWGELALEVVRLTWQEDYCTKTYYWIIGTNQEVAEGFFRAVCAWCSEVRGEVLIFEQSYWRKSAALYESICRSTYEQIILAGDLKQRIHEDFARFFASRATYERYGVPWKRGVLFIGPPGNGKTQMVKAVMHAMGAPCLYVKSFNAPRGDPHANVRAVFERARQATPCFLVLEDLDSLIDANNRSFFLNELDGFATNTGIVVLATTNHPERLDPAILDRPSRFDRKYHFNLPAKAERATYLRLWNESLEPELRLSKRGVTKAAGATDGFSFAYLKELMLSSIMAWMDRSVPGSMDGILIAQAALLREQMAYIAEPAPSVDADYDDEENEE